MTAPTLSPLFDDPVNARILAVSEDRLQGFQADPFGAIADQAGLEPDEVMARVRVMLEAGTIRRVRQTLLATNLAQGALVAWQVPADRIDAAFAFMFEQDPFSGHVVLRSTDTATAGANYKLWTTVKVPQGFSLAKHCSLLAAKTGAEKFVLLPAKRLFALGVGHTRRRGMPPGSRAAVPAEAVEVRLVSLTDHEWKILTALKREFAPAELCRALWEARAAEAGVSLEEFTAVAADLQQRGVIGRFSTFLEHVKPVAGGQRVTRFNALFHWSVPPGRELDAGCEVGRHDIMTHAYWREGGPEFHKVNIMGVAHGTDKPLLLEHKAAIDAHLEQAGIPIRYTNVFWGGRSEIKPSEISPFIYRAWCEQMGVETNEMRSPRQPVTDQEPA